MKKIFSFALTALVSGGAFAQNFSGKTNDVVLDFKKENQAATSLPAISWETPRIEHTIGQSNELGIEASITSDVPLTAVRIVLGDGIMVRGEKNLHIPPGTSNHKVNQVLKLLNGQNTIEIIAENANGGAISSTRYVLIGKDAIANAVDVNRSDYALIIATDSYDDLGDLVNPIDDARAIEEIIRTKYGFKTEMITNPTHEEIYEKIAEYNTRKFNPQDQLMVFFAGHGVYDENLGEGFVAARNSALNDKGRSTYIPHSILRQRLDNIKCEHIFLAMDVCFGGTLDPTFQRSRDADTYAQVTDIDFLARKLSVRTRKFLTSGSKEYVSDGIPGKHSPFAALFILALKETGGKGSRLLTLYDLYPYFQKMATQPRFGKFSDRDESASDFVFVTKQN